MLAGIPSRPADALLSALKRIAEASPPLSQQQKQQKRQGARRRKYQKQKVGSPSPQNRKPSEPPHTERIAICRPVCKALNWLRELVNRMAKTKYAQVCRGTPREGVRRFRWMRACLRWMGQQTPSGGQTCLEGLFTTVPLAGTL